LTPGAGVIRLNGDRARVRARTIRTATRLLVTLALATTSAVAQAESVSISPVQDGTLYQDIAGGLANGAGQYLFVGRSAQPNSLSRRRAVLKFDVAGALPPNSTISKVTLTLFMSRTITASSTVSVHRLLAGWGEGTSQAGGEEGTGAPPEPNDATWIHRFFNTDLWTTPGGDFDPTPSATRTVVGLGFYDWGSTERLVADVQGWVDDPSSNHGWIMIGPEVFPRSTKRFDSRENNTMENRPVLTIEFTHFIPTTSEWGLVILALSLLVAAKITFAVPVPSSASNKLQARLPRGTP